MKNIFNLLEVEGLLKFGLVISKHILSLVKGYYNINFRMDLSKSNNLQNGSNKVLSRSCRVWLSFKGKRTALDGHERCKSRSGYSKKVDLWWSMH